MDVCLLVALGEGSLAFHSSGKSPNIETHSLIRWSLLIMKLLKGGFPTTDSIIFNMTGRKPQYKA